MLCHVLERDGSGIFELAMKAAGVVSLIFAAILLFAALSSFYEDSQSASSNISGDFAALNAGDDATLNRHFAAEDNRQQQQMIEGIAGAVFLIAGIAMCSARKPQPVVTLAAAE